MKRIEYDRQKAKEYAKKWAYGRNPAFYDYEKIGGDCTNFASQCVYAGSQVMNFAPTYGWYYIDANNKSPAWTGVNFFYNFMTQNEGVGPFGRAATLEELDVGDVIQLGDANGNYYHTLMLTAIREDTMGRRYYICAHTVDSYMRNLSSYNYANIRCIHFLGVRSNEIRENMTDFSI